MVRAALRKLRCSRFASFFEAVASFFEAVASFLEAVASFVPALVCFFHRFMSAFLRRERSFSLASARRVFSSS